MSADSIEVREQYLLDYLVDEFRHQDQVWIRHRSEGEVRGLLVRADSREYFFPFEWCYTDEGFGQVKALVLKIQDLHVR